MKRSAWGTLAMTLSFLLGTIIAVGSLLSMGGILDTESLLASPLSVPTILVSCLDPFAILLEIAAIVLILVDSKRAGKLHRRLAWIAAAFFIIWGILNLAIFLPISFIGMRSGSLALVKTGQMVKVGAALLQYTVPFLLVYGISGKMPRIILWLAMILTIIGNFVVVALPIAGLALQAIEESGETLFVPRLSVDYTTGIYPFFLGMGYLGGFLYMIAYAILTIQLFKTVRLRRQDAIVRN